MSNPDQKIDYGRPGSENGWPAKVGGWFGERLSGIAIFVGMVIAMFGITGRHLKLAFGLGFAAMGLGLVMLDSRYGVSWMFLGAFLTGLGIPPSRTK